MSLIATARSLGRHRGQTPHQLRAALDQAHAAIEDLTGQLDASEQARAALVSAHRNLQGRFTEALHDRDALARDNAGLRVRLTVAEQRIANLDPFHVPAAMDHWPTEDQPTPPVMPLWKAPFAAGRPGPVDSETTLTIHIPTDLPKEHNHHDQ